MILVNLPMLMAQNKDRITTVAKATGLSRTTLVSLYYGRAKQVSFTTLEALCKYFHCGVGDILILRPGIKNGDSDPFIAEVVKEAATRLAAHSSDYDNSNN